MYTIKGFRPGDRNAGRNHPLVTGRIFQEENMREGQRYDDAVRIIKTAILQSRYDAAGPVNEKQLMLCYGIGK